MPYNEGGKSGEESAKDYLEGNLTEPKHGYGGTAPNKSKINKKQVEYGDEKIMEEESPKKVVEQFPFIKDGDQEREFPRTGTSEDDLDG